MVNAKVIAGLLHIAFGVIIFKSITALPSFEAFITKYYVWTILFAAIGFIATGRIAKWLGNLTGN